MKSNCFMFSTELDHEMLRILEILKIDYLVLIDMLLAPFQEVSAVVSVNEC